MNTTIKSRNWTITIASALLSLLFVYFALNAWTVPFEGPVPGEPVIRTLIAVIFVYMSYRFAKVARRGYTRTSLRAVARDFFAGIQ